MTRDDAATRRLLFEYLLRLADTALVLAQRLVRMGRQGAGPRGGHRADQRRPRPARPGAAVVRLRAARSRRASRASGRSEDQLAFLRDAHEFRNLLLVEQPNGNYADTIARQFLFDHWHLLLLRALTRSTRCAHRGDRGQGREGSRLPRRALGRLGDPPGRRHRRIARAHAGGDRRPVDVHRRDVRAGRRRAGAGRRRASPPTCARCAAPWRRRGRTPCSTRRRWRCRGDDVRAQQGGKQGVHTEHLGQLLAEMQFLQRAYPGAQW